MKLAEIGPAFFSDIEGVGRFLPHLTFFLPYGFKIVQSVFDYTSLFFCIGSFWILYSPPRFGFESIFGVNFGGFPTEFYSQFLINWFVIVLIPMVFNVVLIAAHKSYQKTMKRPMIESGPFADVTTKNSVWFVLVFALVYTVTISLTSAFVSIPIIPLIVLVLMMRLDSNGSLD